MRTTTSTKVARDISLQYRLVTDRQTDRQTDTSSVAIGRIISVNDWQIVAGSSDDFRPRSQKFPAAQFQEIKAKSFRGGGQRILGVVEVDETKSIPAPTMFFTQWTICGRHRS